MDVTYSTLAFADAIHDFKDLAIRHASTIQAGLPGRVLNIHKLIATHMIENTLFDIIFNRANNMELLFLTDTPDAIYNTLCAGYETFGLVSDANGANSLIEHLESGTRPYYVVRNVENLCDSAVTPDLNYVTKGIIMTNVVGNTVKYSRWDKTYCISSKFCSNHDYMMIAQNSSEVKYLVDLIYSETIDANQPLANPNNKSSIRDFISHSSNTADISVAFQRKRSGDWLQALSTLDTERHYLHPTGRFQKLRCPIYFCTEDRVAAAYALAIGVNTIYLNRRSTVHLLYKNNISISLTTDFFLCSPNMSVLTNHHKNIIRSGLNAYEMYETMIIDMLNNDIDSNNDADDVNAKVLQYIGYMYLYALSHDLVGSHLITHRTILEGYLTSDSELCTLEEMDILRMIYDTCEANVPKLMSHDIHAKAAFPSLPTLRPISLSGIVGSSEIYIAGLLEEFKKYATLAPYIAKCISYIIANSVGSDGFHLHYNGILSTSIPHSGGLIRNNKDVRFGPKELGLVYISYLLSGDRYNEICRNEFRFVGCTDFVYCDKSLKKLSLKYGTLKKELANYEKIKESREKELREEERPDYDPEADARLLKIVMDSYVKRGKPVPDVEKHMSPELLAAYRRI